MCSYNGLDPSDQLTSGPGHEFYLSQVILGYRFIRPFGHLVILSSLSSTSSCLAFMFWVAPFGSSWIDGPRSRLREVWAFQCARLFSILSFVLSMFTLPVAH